MPTLLEKAKAEQPYKFTANYSKDPQHTSEEMELLKAYLNGELTVRQISTAMEWKNHGNITHWLGKMLMRIPVIVGSDSGTIVGRRSG